MAMQLIWHMFSALTQQGVSAVYLEVPASVIMIHLLQISWTVITKKNYIQGTCSYQISTCQGHFHLPEILILHLPKSLVSALPL